MIRCSVTVFIYCHIDMYRRSLFSLCVCVCVCVDTTVYTFIRTGEFKSPRVCQETGVVRTFNKHSSLAIFDKHLVRQTNQGLPKILPQYHLETALTVT